MAERPPFEMFSGTSTVDEFQLDQQDEVAFENLPKDPVRDRQISGLSVQLPRTSPVYAVHSWDGYVRLHHVEDATKRIARTVQMRQLCEGWGN
jgi:hypothetical protein